MRVLVVYCHPCEESFNAVIRDHAIRTLEESGHEVTLIDLYAENFDPVMRAAERRDYHTPTENERPVQDHLDRLRRAEGLIFIYPTWWYGLPAMLKGWLDRVWVPHAVFKMPEPGLPIRGNLPNIRLVGAISTLGSPNWWWWFIGMPGRRTLLTGLPVLCARKTKTFWLGLHRMDSTTQGQRTRFLERISAKLRRLA
jgi:putative NADPH-quinone reductase